MVEKNHNSDRCFFGKCPLRTPTLSGSGWLQHLLFGRWVSTYNTHPGVEEPRNATGTETLLVLLTTISQPLPRYVAHKYLWNERTHSQTGNVYMSMFIIPEFLQFVPHNLALIICHLVISLMCHLSTPIIY